MKYNILKTVARILASVVLLWVCGGCAALEKTTKSKTEEVAAEAVTTPSVEPETGAKQQESAPFVHTVRWVGESVSLIAKWYTGSYKNWRKIAAANPKLNPNIIRIGDKIVIPQELLKTKDPMKRDFISSSKKKSEPVKSEEHSKEAESTELFGPKK